VFSGTSYIFQTLPTVNDGQLLLAGNSAGATSTSVAVNYTVLNNASTGPFTANKATNSTLQLSIGPAISDYVTKMTGGIPVNPASGPNVLEVNPRYLTKTAEDTLTLATPVTTFSPGTTGFTIRNAYTNAPGVSSALNGQVVLGGVLNVASGGTGTSTAPTAGQVLVGNNNGGYTAATITGSGGIEITTGNGTLNIGNTGVTPSILNGLHVHSADNSIRLGSGNSADGDTIRPLTEKTDIRMNGQFYRLSNNNVGYITEVGFQIDDASNQKQGFFGASASTNATTANVPGAAFAFTGVGGTALAAYRGFYINNTTLADPKFYMGLAGGLRQEVLISQNTAASNIIKQVGTWGTTANTTFYEAIPSASTIQIGAAAGNNTYIKIEDAISKVTINKGIVYGTAYGLATPEPLDNNTTAKYILATGSNGKFYEIPGISIGSIIVPGTLSNSIYTPTTLATSAVPNALTIQGSGNIGVTLSGSVLTISGGATAFPYWSQLSFNTAGTGTVNGSSGSTASITPDQNGPNTLTFTAGNNINFTTTNGAASDTIVISATVPQINSWGNITFSGNSTAAGGGTLVLQPDSVLDGLGINAGTGIGITVTGGGSGTTADSFQIVNTGVTSITGGNGVTVNASTGSVEIGLASSVTYTSNEGITKATGNVFKLGAPTDQATALSTIPLLGDRFINGNNTNTEGTGYKLDIETPIGEGRGVLHLTSTNVGRALRAVNNLIASSNPEGAIYASSNQPGSTDGDPSGTIYAEVTGGTNPMSEGSAIVGKGVMISGETVRPAIFGSGYIGVKGYNIKGQVESPGTFLAGGIGVWGASVYVQNLVPGAESDSVWGVVGSTISNTNLILPYLCNTGTGVYGEAVGANRSNYGTGSDNTGFAARFATRSSGVVAQPTIQPLGITIPLGLRHMANVTDVVQIVRRSNNSVTQNVTGIGGAIVFNVEGGYNSPLNDAIKAGRVGYKLSTITNPASSRFFVTTVNGAAGTGPNPTLNEVERLAIRDTGQVELSAYSYLSPAVPGIQGMFTPSVVAPTVTGFSNNYDYIIPAAKTVGSTNDEQMGRLDTLRTRHGQYDPATIVIGGTTGYNLVDLTVTIDRAYYTSINNIVTVHVTGTISFPTTAIDSSRSFDMPLPIPANTTFGNNDVVFSMTLNNYRMYPFLGMINGQSIAGSNQRYRIIVPNTAVFTSGAVSSSLFSAIFTYKLI